MPSGGGDYTRVDIGLLREKANTGQQKVSQLDSLLQEMDQAMNSTDSFWEGDAAKLYREVFRIELSRMREDFEQYRSYPQELSNYADLYEGTERKAETIANEIEQADWAEV